jgi:hypothetical protein
VALPAGKPSAPCRGAAPIACPLPIPAVGYPTLLAHTAIAWMGSAVSTCSREQPAIGQPLPPPIAVSRHSSSSYCCRTSTPPRSGSRLYRQGGCTGYRARIPRLVFDQTGLMPDLPSRTALFSRNVHSLIHRMVDRAAPHKSRSWFRQSAKVKPPKHRTA